jgi:hypothetical protein
LNIVARIKAETSHQTHQMKPIRLSPIVPVARAYRGGHSRMDKPFAPGRQAPGVRITQMKIYID